MKAATSLAPKWLSTEERHCSRHSLLRRAQTSVYGHTSVPHRPWCVAGLSVDAGCRQHRRECALCRSLSSSLLIAAAEAAPDLDRVACRTRSEALLSRHNCPSGSRDPPPHGG
jgi:hypothetical protein